MCIISRQLEYSENYFSKMMDDRNQYNMSVYSKNIYFEFLTIGFPLMLIVHVVINHRKYLYIIYTQCFIQM